MGVMAYGHIMSFMYDVGRGVCEFLHEDEQCDPDTLPQIVHEYAQTANWLDIFLLRKQIKHYLARYAVDGAVAHYDPPFNQELRFVEERFNCQLLEFLNQVLILLEEEIGDKRYRFVDKLISHIYIRCIRV